MGEGFPLWSLASMAWEGREPLRDWICLSVSLCFCVLVSALSPFRIYMEIRNSDWTETFAVIFLNQKIAFLRPKKGINRLMGGPRGSGARPGKGGAPPVSWPPRASSRVDSSSQKSQIFQKYSPSVFIPFGFPFLRYSKTRKKQKLALGSRLIG